MNIWRWRLGWMARRMSPPTSAAKIIVIQVFITVTIITVTVTSSASSASSSTLFFFRKYGWTHTGIPSGGNCTGSKSLKHCFQWLETFETFSLARNLWNIWDRSANCPRVDDLDPTLSDLVFSSHSYCAESKVMQHPIYSFSIQEAAESIQTWYFVQRNGAYVKIFTLWVYF